MADWVTGKVTKVHNWTDALFSLTVRAPVHPFTAGQFTKLGLEIDGERVQRAYSYVNAPDNPDPHKYNLQYGFPLHQQALQTFVQFLILIFLLSLQTLTADVL